ncbi:protein prenyltransferase alpha subunit repeat-containing protein 1 [Pseudoliparis swirei]|uniref:protein prenyltransferase alpha subunit repeat-containing protein 1 n=1 Tax=Pseudoliparis swirei TaxID=2059687 RepID=UPI0024BD66F5|nr:protein prenyltransferase alpha subunit repeat-containing protein 1 [Pseudoliparis swirei]
MAESEEEVDVLVQRVVKDITNAFKKNPNIDEVGVIPCPEARYNRSPIVLLENKLGVESWCVKFLLPSVHNKLLLYRQRKLWLDREALADITCTLLLLNPDFTTAWNVRKELLLCGALSPEKDLYLGKLALTKFPKSPETWIHRRWVLQQILGQSSTAGRKHRSPRPGEHLARTLHQEIKVCSDAAGRYPSNYNAWSHRVWVLRHMANGNVKVFHDELSSMRLWVSMHVSDHSGFHYRQFLLKELISQTPASTTSSPQHQSSPSPPHHDPANGELSGSEEEEEDEEEKQISSTAVLQLFHQEVELCSDLIQSFPGHETLWSHRRHVYYLWHHWRGGHQRHRGSEPDRLDNGDPGPPEAGAPSGGVAAAAAKESVNGQRRAGEAMEVDDASLPDPRGSKRLKRGAPPALPAEHGFVSGILDSCSNPEQRRFALAYRKWLDTVIGHQP